MGGSSASHDPQPLEAAAGGGILKRLETLMDRLAALPPDCSAQKLQRLRKRFDVRHRALEQLAERCRHDVLAPLQQQRSLGASQQLLLGSYLTHDYTLESAALFNPSLVPTPIRMIWRAAACGWCSACGPRARGTSPRSGSQRWNQR